jgi:hypothetical protein
MAALDAAIHGKAGYYNVTLDGRVKPGHDNGSAYDRGAQKKKSPG